MAEHRPPHPDDYGRLLAQGIEPGPPRKPQGADWTVWSYIDRCKLWEGVVLTLNFDPRYFEAVQDGRGGIGIVPRRVISRMPLEAAIHTVPPEDFENIHNRLRIALSQPTTVIKPLDLFVPLGPESTISLPALWTWAVGIWPDLPAEFPRRPGGMDSAALERIAEETGLVRTAKPLPDPLPPSEKNNPVDDSKPLHTKERTTLLKIIRVLATEAKLPDEPYKAAKSVVAAAAKLDVSISENSVAAALKAARDLVGGAQKD